jgi:hypothetical protein
VGVNFLKKKNSLSLCTEWRIAIFAKRGKTMKEKKTTKSDKDWIEIDPPTDLKQIFDAVHADINAALKRLGDAMQKLKPEELISGRGPENEVPKAVVRQARAALMAVRTRLLKCAGEFSKPMEERLKNCPAADVNESMLDGLSIEEQKVIGPLLRSVAEINKQIERIEEIEGDKALTGGQVS